MIDLQMLLHLVIQLIIIGGVCWLLWWLIGYCGIPEPFNKVARIAVAVIAVILLINILLGLGGGGVSTGRPLFHW